MFGQNKPGGFSGFGTSNNNTTFGNNFGQSTGFGGGSTFGAQTQPTGGGLFGGATGTTGNAGGLFGQQSSGFGATQSTGGFSFGGNQTANTGGGLFGNTSQPAAGSGSLFATPASGTGFGAPKPAGFAGFGASNTTGGGGSLFGASTGATPSLFGAQAGSTGAFGGATTAAAGGTVVAFNPPSGTDTMMKDRQQTNINTRHQCITAMKEYEAKSIEELRFEDYTANRKSKQAGSTTTGGGLFGQTAATPASTSGFVFGGGLSSGGLGQTSTPGFGGFGTSSSATSTPFGAARPSLFGAATTTTQSGFGFGTPTGTQQSSSLFGGTTARPLFGGTASSQPSLTGGSSFFGGTQAASNPVGFGTSTAGGGLFGAAKPTGFGAPTSSSIGFGTGGSSLFGKTSTASTFGGFGTNTSTAGAFGVPKPSTAGTSGGSMFNLKPGGFGTGTTGLGTGTSSFGFGAGLGTNPAAGTSTFGTGAAKPGGFGGFSFGGTSSTANTGFGSTLTNNAGTGAFNLGGGLNTLGGAPAANQAANSSQYLLALASSPYGDNPLFWNLTQKTAERREDALKPTNPSAQKAALASANQYKVSPRPINKIKPKSLHNLVNGGKAQLFEGLEEEDFSFGDFTFVPRKSVKKLVLRKGLASKSVSGSVSNYSDADQSLNQSLNQSGNNQSPSTGDVLSITRPLSDNREENLEDNEAEQSTPLTSKIGNQRTGNLDESYTAATTTNNAVSSNSGVMPATLLPVRLADTTPFQNRPDFDSPTPTSNTASNISGVRLADSTAFLDTSDFDNSCMPCDSSSIHPTGITLTRPGYYTIPALDDMVACMDEQGNCMVEDLTIGRYNYGNIYFPGITNVAGMNLDDIVHIRRKEVVVYPDDDKKPPLGDGLNKRAQVTLDCVWPTDKSTKTPIKSPERLRLMNYAEKIELTTAKIGGKFIDYRQETGSWVFQVEHFSKYGLHDDDDDDDDAMMDPAQLSASQAKDILLVQKLKMQQEQQLLEQQKQKMQQQGKLGGLMGGLGDMQTPMKLGEQAMLEDEDSYTGLDDFQGFPDAKRSDKLIKAGLDFDEEEMEAGMDSKLLATSMGVSVQNIQGMKASFFGDGFDAMARKKQRQLEMEEEEDDNLDDSRSMWNRSGKDSGRRSLFVQPSILPLPQSPSLSDRTEKDGYEPTSFGKAVAQTFSQPPVLEHPILRSGLTLADLPTRIHGTRQALPSVDPRMSLLHDNQKSIADAACYHGRSFRTGWGPGWCLTHSGACLALKEDHQTVSMLPMSVGKVAAPLRSQGWLAHIEQVVVSHYMDSSDATLCHQLQQMLEIQLNHSRLSVENGSPKLVPSPGVEALHSLAASLSHSLTQFDGHPDLSAQKHMDSVMRLCVALWGDIPQDKQLEKDEIYYERQLRREAFSNWLEDTCAPIVDAEIEASSPLDTESSLKGVYSALTAGRVSSACVLARRGGDSRLALLLAQSMGGPVVRQMLAQQFDAWAQQGVLEFMSELRQQVYCLLAGQLVWTSTDRHINTCKGLDWKRALALHLWYKSPANASVQHTVRQYQQGFQGTEHTQAYCRAPLPPYLERDGAEVCDSEEIYDTCYHLLCLFTDRMHALEGLLSPTSSSPAHLDYRLSWLLHEILESLGYSHLGAQKSDALHLSFSSQLEALGLWQWACLPLMRLDSAFGRRAAIEALLQRHLLDHGEQLSDKETFLVERLRIPAAWIHRAKAIRAHYLGEPALEARHLILAGMYNQSHAVVVSEIAADAIINDEDKYLKSYLDELSPPECSIGILNWNSAGKVFLDFIDLRARMDGLKSAGSPSADDLEQLESGVTSLCRRVKAVKCSGPRDKLCQAEMAKTSARLLRTFMELRGISPYRSLLTEVLVDLPMPEDYSLQELQATARAGLLEMC